MKKAYIVGTRKRDVAMRLTQQTVRLLEQRFLENEGISTKVNRFYQQKTAELMNELGFYD